MVKLGRGALTLFYLLFMNTCVITVRKLIFDRFSFGDFDGSPVVNMNLGAEKGTNAPVQALRGVESPQVYAVVLRGNIVCVRSCVFDPSVLYHPLSNQMMIKIIRSPFPLIMFTLTFSTTNPVFWGEHRLASDHKY